MDDLKQWWKSLSDSTREALLEDPRRVLTAAQVIEVKNASGAWWVDTQSGPTLTLPSRYSDYVESLKDSED